MFRRVIKLGIFIKWLINTVKDIVTLRGIIVIAVVNEEVRLSHGPNKEIEGSIAICGSFVKLRVGVECPGSRGGKQSTIELNGPCQIIDCNRLIARRRYHEADR